MSPRRAATDRAVSSPAATAAGSSDQSCSAAEEIKLLQAQVEQWRHHGHLLSETMRGMQDELDRERTDNANMKQLLHVQEQKIALLEKLAGAAGQHSTEQPATPSWMPKWLSLPDGRAQQPPAAAAASPPWSRWLPREAKDPPPPPAAAAANVPAAAAANAPAAPLPSPPAAPSTPPASGVAANETLPPTPHTPQVADWSDAHSAARKLSTQLKPEHGGGYSESAPAVSARSVENFLESFLSAVAPDSPPKQPRQPLSPLALPGVTAQPALGCKATGGSRSATRTPVKGGDGAFALDGDAASVAARRGVQMQPCVVALASACEDYVSHEPSPPVTIRSRESSRHPNLPGKGRKKSVIGSSEATSISEATSRMSETSLEVSDFTD